MDDGRDVRGVEYDDGGAREGEEGEGEFRFSEPISSTGWKYDLKACILEAGRTNDVNYRLQRGKESGKKTWSSPKSSLL